MKILRIAFENIGIFKEGFSIDMTAKDKVAKDGQVYKLSSTIFSQNIIGVVGPNASGKTTLLRLISMAITIVGENEGLDDFKISEGILKDGSIMTVDYFDSNKIFRLRSTIGVSTDKFNKAPYFFKDEVIYSKLKSTVKSRKDIFEFGEESILATRAEFIKNEMSLLKPQDSIVAAYVKNKNLCLDTLRFTNNNFLWCRGTEPEAFVNLFDNSIKSIETEGEETKITFKKQQNEDNEKVVKGPPLEIGDYLSSGTVKGIFLLRCANYMIEFGGYLIVDEIENHLHKKLVQVIMELFNNPEINKKGATLIFSTHYSEIMDCIERKDNIYIMLRTDDYISKAVRYSDKVTRNDLKKSDVLLSNYIDGTAPSYESVQLVKEALCNFWN